MGPPRATSRGCGTSACAVPKASQAASGPRSTWGGGSDDGATIRRATDGETGDAARRASNGAASSTASSNAETLPPEVPWDVTTIAQVLILWLFGFCLVGGVAIPALSLLFESSSGGAYGGAATPWKQAIFTVIVDVIQAITGLGILRACVAKYNPRRLGLFPMKAVSLSDALKVAACAITFPLIMRAYNAFEPMPASNLGELLSFTPLERAANGLYVLWTTTASPVWEEVLFRGFLMPSLRKYVPLPAAVALSALVFALLHFSLSKAVPLTLLGIIFGTVFAWSGTLLAPMALHSLWNVFAFCTTRFFVGL